MKKFPNSLDNKEVSFYKDTPVYTGIGRNLFMNSQKKHKKTGAIFKRQHDFGGISSGFERV